MLLLCHLCVSTQSVIGKDLLSEGWTPLSLYVLLLLTAVIILSVHGFASLPHGKSWRLDRRNFIGILVSTLSGKVFACILGAWAIKPLRKLIATPSSSNRQKKEDMLFMYRRFPDAIRKQILLKRHKPMQMMRLNVTCLPYKTAERKYPSNSREHGSSLSQQTSPLNNMRLPGKKPIEMARACKGSML
jgi:hypothetical protein